MGKIRQDYTQIEIDTTVVAKGRGRNKGPFTENSLLLIESLNSLEVGQSASLKSKAHTIKVRNLLKKISKMENPPIDFAKKDFTCGQGLDGKQHVWRDR